jgi:hypothetical protein
MSYSKNKKHKLDKKIGSSKPLPQIRNELINRVPFEWVGIFNQYFSGKKIDECSLFVKKLEVINYLAQITNWGWAKEKAPQGKKLSTYWELWEEILKDSIKQAKLSQIGIEDDQA